MSLEFSIEKKHIRRGEQALVEYVLGRLQQVDERQFSDPRLAQEIFLLKHQKELSEKVENKLIPKLLEDVGFILKEGCAREISKIDFNHVHLCSFSPFPLFDIDMLLSSLNVGLLYHTCEERFAMPYYAKRNIKSSLAAPPEIIPIEYSEYTSSIGWKTYRFSKTTIYSSDLGWSEYGTIKFEVDPTGSYQLQNGTKLSIAGLLRDYLMFHIRFDDGIVRLEEEPIGEIRCI